MALNISVFNPMLLRGGAMPQAPMLTADLASQVVALGAQSTLIAGPALVCLVPDEDSRVTLTRTPGYAAPAATALKLKAGAERYFDLPTGGNYINVVAG